MVLYQHDQDFFIKVNGQDLMHSRHHESELELARLGCRHLAGVEGSRILIGGLGMGYTLQQTLTLVSPSSLVMVSELMGAVVDWNRNFLGQLTNQPLEDKRVTVRIGDVVRLLSDSRNAFDAILLDIDNGPDPLTDAGNHRLYSRRGIEACRLALRDNGCLAVWSAAPNKQFERSLVAGNFHVVRFMVPAYLGKGGKNQSRCIWVAAENKSVLPPGGSKPCLPTGKTVKGRHTQPGKKHSG